MRGIITLGELHRRRVAAIRDALDLEISRDVPDFARVEKLERALGLLAVTDNTLERISIFGLTRVRPSLTLAA